MATKLPFKTTFEVDKVVQPIFTGGAVSLDNDARILATTLGEDAVLTDLTTGQRLDEIEGDGEVLTTIALTPSASHLILCSRSLSMRIFSLKIAPEFETVETTLVRTLKPHSTPVVATAIDKTGTLLATGAADGTIKVWDIAGGYVTHTFRGPSVVVSSLHFFEVATAPNDKKTSKKASKKTTEEQDSATTYWRLACGSQDGKVRVWNLHKRNTVAVDENGFHASSVQGLDYSPEKHSLVTASRDKTITWWRLDSNTWRPRRTIQCGELVEAAGFLEGGRFTYSVGTRGRLRLWDTDTGREVTKDMPPRAETEGIVSAIYLPGHSLVLTVQADHTLTLYRVSSAEDETTALELEPYRRISGTHDDVLDLAYILPDQSMMALATNSEDIRIISVAGSRETPDEAGRTCIFGEDVALLKGHEDMVVSLDVDWSGHWIVTGAKDNSARLWRLDANAHSYESYCVFTGHAESLGAVALPKTAPLAETEAFTDPLNHPPPFLLTGSKDQTVKKWEISRQSPQSSGKKPRALYTRKAHERDINAIEVNASGKLFASASQDKTVKIWDVEVGEVQGILKGHRRGVWSVKFSPANLPPLKGENGSVSGKGVVLTGSTDKTIKLWNLSDYTCLRTFEGHSNSVLRVAWLNVPEDETLAKKHIQFVSTGADGLVKVWDANLGETACTLDNHEARVWALAVHPTTNTIVSGSEDSTITFWKDTSAATQAAATEAALKLIEQEQELENYIHAGSYRDAIVLALQLNHPGRLLNLFSSVVTTDKPEEGSLCGVKAVDKVLASLSDEQIFLLLLRLRDWNTNARTAPVAQRVLWALARSYPASKFSGLSVKGARGQKSLQEVLNALKVYTERHYKRLEELVDESYLVEYTLQEMDSLAPALGELVFGEGGGSMEVVMADAA